VSRPGVSDVLLSKAVARERTGEVDINRTYREDEEATETEGRTLRNERAKDMLVKDYKSTGVSVFRLQRLRQFPAYVSDHVSRPSYHLLLERWSVHARRRYVSSDQEYGTIYSAIQLWGSWAGLLVVFLQIVAGTESPVFTYSGPTRALCS
jgi:hypothetical protein